MAQVETGQVPELDLMDKRGQLIQVAAAVVLVAVSLPILAAQAALA